MSGTDADQLRSDDRAGGEKGRTRAPEPTAPERLPATALAAKAASATSNAATDDAITATRTPRSQVTVHGVGRSGWGEQGGDRLAVEVGGDRGGQVLVQATALDAAGFA